MHRTKNTKGMGIGMENIGSREVSTAAVTLAITSDRAEERRVRSELAQKGISAVAVDFGGEFADSVTKIIERAVVAAKREKVIGDTHTEEGGVAGATHEAISQLINKAMGLNVGGKISIARKGAHISVCVFFAIGLLNLNDVAISLGHRVV